MTTSDIGADRHAAPIVHPPLTAQWADDIPGPHAGLPRGGGRRPPHRLRRVGLHVFRHRRDDPDDAAAARGRRPLRVGRRPHAGRSRRLRLVARPWWQGARRAADRRALALGIHRRHPPASRRQWRGGAVGAVHPVGRVRGARRHGADLACGVRCAGHSTAPEPAGGRRSAGGRDRRCRPCGSGGGPGADQSDRGSPRGRRHDLLGGRIPVRATRSAPALRAARHRPRDAGGRVFAGLGRGACWARSDSST